MDTAKELIRKEGESESEHLQRVAKWTAAQVAATKVAATKVATEVVPRGPVDLSAYFSEPPREEKKEVRYPGTPKTEEVSTRKVDIVTGFFPTVESRAMEVIEGEYEVDWEPHSIPPIVGVDALYTRLGGKQQLVERLVTLFPKTHVYVEVFGGTFKVLFSKPWIDKVEIINEIDNDLVYFYLWVRHDPESLVDVINSVPNHEAVHLGLRRDLKDRKLEGIYRAAATFISIKTSFNGMISDSRYKSSPYQRLNVKASLADFRKVQERLEHVNVRSRDFRDLIKVTNKAVPGGVFFYLDPPYWMTEGYVSHTRKLDFGWKDHKDLSYLCYEIHKTGNKFIQTNSAHEDLRSLYFGYKNPDGSPAFNITEVDVYYSVAGDSEHRKQEKEFIISNFPLVQNAGSLFRR